MMITIFEGEKIELLDEFEENKKYYFDLTRYLLHREAHRLSCTQEDISTFSKLDGEEVSPASFWKGMLKEMFIHPAWCKEEKK